MLDKTRSKRALLVQQLQTTHYYSDFPSEKKDNIFTSKVYLNCKLTVQEKQQQNTKRKKTKLCRKKRKFKELDDTDCLTDVSRVLIRFRSSSSSSGHH